MQTKIIIIVLFLIGGITCRSRAQESIGISYDFGQILPHAPNMENLKKGPVKGFTFSYAFQNDAAAHWRKFYNYPNIGLSYNYINLGNPDVLGSCHSVNTFAKFPFFPKRRKVNIGFKGSIGLGYINKIYDEIENPENIAISKHINISAEAGFYAQWRFDPIFLEYNLLLNHHSNGLTKNPNLGINVLDHRIGIGMELEQPIAHNPLPAEEKEFDKTNEFWTYASGGRKGMVGFNEKYGFINTTLNYSRRVSVINKLGLGIDFIYDTSLTKLAKDRYEYTGEADINFRFGPHLQGEFLFGKTSFLGAYGFYFGSAEYYISKAYYKVGAKYKFGNAIAVALVRAAPLFKAEVIEIGLGYTFARF